MTLLIVGIIIYLFFGVADYLTSQYVKSKGIHELWFFLRDKQGLYNAPIAILAKVGILAVCLAIYFSTSDENHTYMPWLLIAFGAAQAVGAGFNYSKAK